MKEKKNHYIEKLHFEKINNITEIGKSKHFMGGFKKLKRNNVIMEG